MSLFSPPITSRPGCINALYGRQACCDGNAGDTDGLRGVGGGRRCRVGFPGFPPPRIPSRSSGLCQPEACPGTCLNTDFTSPSLLPAHTMNALVYSLRGDTSRALFLVSGRITFKKKCNLIDWAGGAFSQHVTSRI